ncbi:MAG: MarR family transcriptional regulator [Gemmatimonadaceae bacterium]|nr:MarR family transcriptional regulator [Gemmatimonadaceae bacterium]
MPGTLEKRIGSVRALDAGEALVIGLGVASGDIGAQVSRVLAEHGMSPRQYHVLRMLRGAGAEGLSHADIGRRLVARAPDVTRMMDQLEAQRWISRKPSASDRRIVIHRLTARGRAMLATVAGPLGAFYRDLEDFLGPKASAQLLALCERLIAFANQYDPGSAGAE